MSAGDYLIDQFEASPDGEHFAVALKDERANQRVLFYDGRLLLPYCDDQPPMPTDAPEVFDKRLTALKDRLRDDYRGGFDFAMDRQGAWSADGRFLAVTQSRGFDDRRTSASAAWAPSALIVEPAQAAPGRDYRDYSRRLPFSLSPSRPEVLRSAESPGQPPRTNPLVARFADGALAIATPSMQSGSLLQVPLPRDWRERTIRKELAAQAQ